LPAKLVDQVRVNASACGTPTMPVLGRNNAGLSQDLREVALTPRPWRDRAGLLFVGAFAAPDSPNYDSLCWFVDSVLPLIEQALGYETRLTIVASMGEGVDLARFADHHRITLLGEVVDTIPLYDAHRVFIAPTRLAAGVPYKVHEAASYGVPVVATTLLRDQLGWEDGQDLLAAAPSDPEAFANHIIALYRTEGDCLTFGGGTNRR